MGLNNKGTLRKVIWVLTRWKEGEGKTETTQSPPLSSLIIISRVIIIKCMLFWVFLWKKTTVWITLVPFSLAELLRMKLKFQQSDLEKHSAYYTAQFPILSQVRTQTHTHTYPLTHTRNTKWSRGTKQSPRQARWYKNTDKKEQERQLLCEAGEG